MAPRLEDLDPDTARIIRALLQMQATKETAALTTASEAQKAPSHGNHPSTPRVRRAA